MNYRGSCHCGTIAYEVEGDLDQVIQCNCSLCSRRGWLLWFVPRDRLALKTPASAMHTYTFNTHRLQQVKSSCMAVSRKSTEGTPIMPQPRSSRDRLRRSPAPPGGSG